MYKTKTASENEKSCAVADLSEFRVAQLMRAKSAEGPIQLEQLQGMAVESPANQETREARRQEEQGADMSLISRKDR